MPSNVLYVTENKNNIFIGKQSKHLNVKFCTYSELEKIKLLIPKKIILLKTKYNKNKLIFKRKKIKFSAIVVDDVSKLTIGSIIKLYKIAKPYNILYSGEEKNTILEFKEFKKKYCPIKYNLLDEDILWNRLEKCFFSGQYGDRIGIKDFVLSKNISSEVEYEGNIYLKLKIDFGSEYKQVANYIYNKNIGENTVLEFWPEFLKDSSVEVMYKFSLIQGGSVDNIIGTKIVSDKQLEEMIYIESPETSFIAISIHAKGKGELKLGPIHHRFSRKDLGAMTLGAEVIKDDTTREEILVYFEPGNLKPPLNIYFSGYRTAEGFEGYRLIKGLGRPFMLFTDPRLEGGAFYLGSSELEQKIVNKIKEKMEYLDFKNNEVITSGLSMGTYGALYYGAKISPHAIIVGLPIASLGNVVKNQKTIAPGVFRTSFDVVRKHVGKLNEEANNIINSRFWENFDNADFNNTKFSLSYMSADDYDRTAYQDILSSLKNKNSIVLGKSFEGRHNDAIDALIQSFTKNYKQIIEEDFNG